MAAAVERQRFGSRFFTTALAAPGTTIAASVASRPRGRCHVAIVSDTYAPEVNGVAVTLARLAAGLRARGHKVSVVHPHRPALDPAGPRPDRWVTRVRGMPLPCYEGLRLGLPAGRQLRRRWTDERPDAVYVATEGLLGWSAVGSARRLGIPVYSGFHTNFPGYATHYGLGFLRPVITRYLRAFHRRTRGTVVPTEALRDHLAAAGFSNLGVLGRGVDGDLFTPARRSAALRRAWGLPEDGLAVLSVGRIAPEKNVGLAVRAYRAMQRCHPRLTFVIVGDGPLRATLQAASPDLRFCGSLTGEPLATHYASADVFLFPSETETFGNVTLEAMASGLAVVAFDYAAARLYIRDGQTGVLVPCGATTTFVERAADLVRSPDALPSLRQRARRHVAAVDWPNVVARFETLLTGERRLA
jgi:glycosyltransferase involved in cell wall biosynthesis